MYDSSIREAQLYFKSQIDAIEDQRKELHELRLKFIRYYTIDRVREMPIEHYVLGKEIPENGYNFCYTIERQLDKLGRIIGANAFKFGVYFGKTRSEPEYKYRHSLRFGSNVNEAYANVKGAIIQIIKLGKLEDIKALSLNPISPMFKGKILATYYPDRYLPIFSDKHLKYYLTQLNIDTKELLNSDPIIMREALLNFKSTDIIMKDWSIDTFAYFLYSVYPGPPPKEETSVINNILKGFRQPEFPINPKPVFINLSIAKTNETTAQSRNNAPNINENPNYEEEQKFRKQLGNRGEQLVLQMEKEWLKNKPELARKVKKVELDSTGYDILSFELDGSPRYIEVKATRAKVGQANFFLSSNELSKAKTLKNYWVYLVYDILSEFPKVWRIPNPFLLENDRIKMVPITYKVIINSKED